MKPIIGYLRFTSGVGIKRMGVVKRRGERKFMPYYEEYDRGQLLPIAAYPSADAIRGAFKQFLDQNVVELLDENRQPTTWKYIDKQCKKAMKEAEKEIKEQVRVLKREELSNGRADR